MDLRVVILISLCFTSTFCVVAKQDVTSYAKPLENVVHQDSNISMAVPTKAPETTTTAHTTIAPVTSSSSTTIAPITTTKAPDATTIKAPDTTTTKAPDTTTTKAPDTTTTPKATTTLSPPTTIAPPAPQQPAVWYLQEGNVTCVVVKMIAHINVTYPLSKNETKTVVVPVLGNVNGTYIAGKCNTTNQTVDIVFGDGHHLQLTFVDKDDQFSLGSVQLSVNGSALPDNQTGILVYKENENKFTTPVTLSYKCNKVQNLNLTSSQNVTSVLSVSQLQLQAFRAAADNKFSQALDCETMDTPDMVPIAVGISLGVMIFIVLIAYLVGRRRSQDSGYVSM